MIEKAVIRWPSGKIQTIDNPVMSQINKIKEACMSQSPSEPLASSTRAGSKSPAKRKFRFDNRYVAPLFITCILLVGHLSYGILESYKKTVLAIVAAIVTELILGRIFSASG